MSAYGTKRTAPSALHMSAFDPKRTFSAVKRTSYGLVRKFVFKNTCINLSVVDRTS